jgi:hypothetical protein
MRNNSNLVCIKHRTYKGRSLPTLHCRACCCIWAEVGKPNPHLKAAQ